MPAPKKKPAPAGPAKAKKPNLVVETYYTNVGPKVTTKKDKAAAERGRKPMSKTEADSFRRNVAVNANLAAKKPGTFAPPRPYPTYAEKAYIAAKKDMAAFKRGQAKKK